MENIFWCAECGANTKHLLIPESRTRICACGAEGKYRPEAAGAAIDKKNKENADMKEQKRLTKEDVKEIQRLRASGSGEKELSVKFECSRNTVWRMCNGLVPKRLADVPGFKHGAAAQAAKAEAGAKIKPANKVEAAGPVRAALAAMVEEQVRAQLAGLPAIVEAAVLRLLK